MKNLGLSENWRQWIFGCLSSAHFSNLYKGSQTEFFKATRGLRQGDPLSHFLFSVYAKCFSLMLSNVARSENFSGFQLPSRGPCISHLQYADDTPLFYEAQITQVSNIATFLSCCEVSLGLKVNFLENYSCLLEL
ncbi:hypothetical protein AMTRI_Chr04g183850 [Amborella trichopoda]